MGKNEEGRALASWLGDEGVEASSVTRGKAPSHAGKGGEAETNRGGLLKSPSQKVF